VKCVETLTNIRVRCVETLTNNSGKVRGNPHK
jgi:hypothetical protein